MKKERNISEPETGYSKTIRKFGSFEEMNEADAQEMAGISAVDHLRYTVMLIKRVYSEALKKPMDMQIKFK